MEEDRNMEQAENALKAESSLAAENVTAQDTTEDTTPERDAQYTAGDTMPERDAQYTAGDTMPGRDAQTASGPDAEQAREESSEDQAAQAAAYQPDTPQPHTDTARADSANSDTPKPKKSWKREAWEWIVAIAAALMVVFFCRNYLFQIIRVDGSSMYDTLQDNERLLVNVLDLRLHGVQRDDIVICHYPNRGNTNFVKRAVAVPGDIVVRMNGVTHVLFEENGVLMDEPLDPNMGNFFLTFSSDDYEPYTLGEDEYFVVGDNRYNSHDSRDWKDGNPINDVGPITEDMILGKVTRVIWPMDSARRVD